MSIQDKINNNFIGSQDCCCNSQLIRLYRMRAYRMLRVFTAGRCMSFFLWLLLYERPFQPSFSADNVYEACDVQLRVHFML